MKIRQILGIVAIIAVLGGVSVMVSHRRDMPSNPATKAASTPASRDALRHESLENLAVAIRTSTKLHNGVYPFVIPRVETGICNGVSPACKKAKLVDLSQVVSDGSIASIPNDPSGGSGQYTSGYALRRNADGSIVLLAPRTEDGQTISVRI